MFERHTINGNEYTTHPAVNGFTLLDSNGQECAKVEKSNCNAFWLFQETTPPAENEIFNNRAHLNIHENAPNVQPDLIEGALVMFYQSSL